MQASKEIRIETMLEEHQKSTYQALMTLARYIKTKFRVVKQHRIRPRPLLRLVMRRSVISSLLLFFLSSATSASYSFADPGTSSSDDGNLPFSETAPQDLEPLDFDSVLNSPPPPLTEEIFSDSYGSTINDFLASDPNLNPSECSALLPLPPGGRIGVRSDFCSSDPQDPSSSGGSDGEAQPAGRILSAEDLENYWCSGSPRKLDLANIPVCEVALYADDNLLGLATNEVFSEVIFCNLSLLSLPFLLFAFNFQFEFRPRVQ